MEGTWTKQPLDDRGLRKSSLELPERFVNATPEGLPMPLREIVVRYFKNFGQHYLAGIAPSFFGRAETFKTYSAAVIARWVDGWAGKDVEFVDAGVEFMRLEAQRFSEDSLMRIDRLATVDFLVLDDITNIRSRTQAENFLMAVVSRRFNATLPTVYTGNWSFDRDRQGFIEHYSPALDRRIRRGSDGFLIVTG